MALINEDELVESPDYSEVEDGINFTVYVDTDIIENYEKELNEVDALSEQVRDLEFLADSIEESSGMTRQYAVEAEKLLPTFPKLHPGYYTERPTLTRLAISLEEIHKGLLALIAAGIAALMAVIYKVVKWITGNKEDDKESLKKTSEVAKKVIDDKITSKEELTKYISLMETLLETVRPISVQIKENAVVVNTLEQAADLVFSRDGTDDRVWKIVEAQDPIFHDLLVEGPYSKFMVSISKIGGSLIDAMMLRERTLRQVLETDLKSITSVQSMMDNTSLIKLITQPITINVNGKQLTIQEIIAETHKLKSMASESSSNSRLTFDQMYKRISQLDSKYNYANVLHNNKKMIDQLIDLDKTIHTYNSSLSNGWTDGTLNEPSKLMGGIIRHAFMTITKELISVKQLLAEMDQYGVTSVYYLKEISGIISVLFKRIDKIALRDTEENIILSNDWKVLGNKISKTKVEEQNSFNTLFHGIFKK